MGLLRAQTFGKSAIKWQRVVSVWPCPTFFAENLGSVNIILTQPSKIREIALLYAIANRNFCFSEEFYNFVKATSWEESVRADMIEVLKHYKEEGVTTFGIFGFCFGGKIAALATGEFFEDIRVAAHFHPSSMNMSDAELIRSPTILLPGANDPDMVSNNVPALTTCAIYGRIWKIIHV